MIDTMLAEHGHYDIEIGMHPQEVVIKSTRAPFVIFVACLINIYSTSWRNARCIWSVVLIFVLRK